MFNPLPTQRETFMPEDPLVPSTPPPPPGGPPAASGPTSTGMAPNTAAGIAVLFTFVSGIIFLVIEKRSSYVRFWAMQATIYGLIWVAIRIVLEIFTFLVRSSLDLLLLLYHVWQLFNLVFLIGLVIMLYYAFTGKEWEMPVLGKFARQQLTRFPPSQS